MPEILKVSTTCGSDLKQQFLHSLKRGTGEAYLILKQNPGADFSNMIVKAAVKNFAYDPQCEGSRADYVYRLIARAPQQDKIVRSVLARFQKEKSDHWNNEQMCDLAVLFFRAGHLEAKSALYKLFEKSSVDNNHPNGESQLMEIDGIDGVLKVAHTVGKKILEENSWEDSWRIDDFQKKNKRIQVYAELEKAGRRNKFIAAYYKEILANKWSLPKRKKFRKFTYETVKAKIDANTFRFMSVDRANDLSVKEVEQLAREAMAEKDKKKQELYLRFFAKRKFPFDYQPLLKIAKGKNPSKTHLVHFAVNCLKYFSGDDIRALALDKLNTLKNPAIYLNLLVSNYRKGDHKLLDQIIHRSDNENVIHSIGFGLLAIYEANKVTECKKPLESLYNKMNCGMCRADVVRRLLDNGVLSDKIRQEIEFDSNNELHKLYAGLDKMEK